MPAYLIVDTAIENADAYEKYKALAKPITEQYGGVYRARGANMGVLETDLVSLHPSWWSLRPCDIALRNFYW